MLARDQIARGYMPPRRAGFKAAVFCLLFQVLFYMCPAIVRFQVLISRFQINLVSLYSLAGAEV